MSNIGAYPGGISSGSDAIASAVSSAFDMIKAAINSGAINSDNMGANSILSTAIIDGAVVAGKIGALAVKHAKIQFASSDGGVRCVQHGSTPPANGIMLARCSNSVAVASGATTTSLVISWANAIDGNPGFTATPNMCAPAINWGNTAASFPTYWCIASKDSTAVSIHGAFASVGSAITATVEINAFGGL